MDINVIEILLLIMGLISIIYALLKAKDDTILDDKIEKVLDDFITQIDVENNETIAKMQGLQNDLSKQIDSKLDALNNKVRYLEDEITKIKSMDLKEKSTPKLSGKYQEVLKLYEEGYNIEEIVTKTKIGHGEIEMLLELIKKGYKYV